MRQRKLIAAFIVVVFAAILAPAAAQTIGKCEADDPAAAAADAGNTKDLARTISPPVACTGDLSENTDPAKSDGADWYSFTLVRGQHLTLDVQPLPGLYATGIRLLEPAPTQQDPKATQDDTATACKDFARQPDSCDLLSTGFSGTWYVGVTRELGTGSYSLMVSTTAAQNDCSLGADAPESVPHAVTPPQVGTDPSMRTATCTSSFDAEDQYDVYSVLAINGETLTAAISSAAPSPQIADVPAIYDPSGALRETPSAPPSLLVDTTGMWFVRIKRADAFPLGSGNSVTYSFSITTIQHDCNTDPFDATVEVPRTVTVETCGGQLDSRTDQPDSSDVFAFPSVPGHPLSVSVKPSAGLCVTASFTGGATSSVACDGNSAAATGTAPDVFSKFTVTLNKGADGKHLAGSYDFRITGLEYAEQDCGPIGDATSGTLRAVDMQPTLADPTKIEGKCSGRINSATDSDPYTFDVKADDLLTGAIDDGFHACVVPKTNPANVPCRQLPFKIPATGTGTWIVNVTGDQPGDYGLTLDRWIADDCSLGIDAADSQADAARLPAITQPLICATKVGGQPGAPWYAAGEFKDAFDTADWYRVQIPGPISGVAAFLVPGGSVVDVASLNPSTGQSFRLCVVPPAPANQAPLCSQNGIAQPNLVLATPCDIPPHLGSVQLCHGNDAGQDTGTWYVSVTPLNGSRGAYRLMIAGTQ